MPMICDPGDVMILNRQAVHGSFANTSPDRRVTLNAGFFPKKRVLNVTTSEARWRDCTPTPKSGSNQRACLIPMAVSARQQHFPEETPYSYKPLEDRSQDTVWDESMRETTLKNYNLIDMYI